ncbi:hypothetical protein H9L39_19332 [Fusarium oxysporum f. sp. albedinis]|nr:hypothetical protein H9L39_19332 [Fusarium oxysporum f. sp. albedinis]
MVKVIARPGLLKLCTKDITKVVHPPSPFGVVLRGSVHCHRRSFNSTVDIINRTGLIRSHTETVGKVT